MARMLSKAPRVDSETWSIRGTHMKKALLPGFLLATWSVAAVAGRIDVGAPFVSGDVARFANRQESGHTALSADQLQQLSLWLRQHRTRWSGLLTEESNEPIQLSLKLARSRSGANT